MPQPENRKPEPAVRRWVFLAIVFLMVVLVSAAWRAADLHLAPQSLPLLKPQQAAFIAVQIPTPTPTISSEDIQAAPSQTTGIIIVTGVVVLIIIYGTVNATRRRTQP